MMSNTATVILKRCLIGVKILQNKRKYSGTRKSERRDEIRETLGFPACIAIAPYR